MLAYSWGIGLGRRYSYACTDTRVYVCITAMILQYTVVHYRLSMNQKPIRSERLVFCGSSSIGAAVADYTVRKKMWHKNKNGCNEPMKAAVQITY